MSLLQCPAKLDPPAIQTPGCAAKPKRVLCRAAIAVAAILTLPRPASADLLILKDARPVAGRVVNESDAEIVLKTGTPTQMLERRFARDRVARIARGMSEIERLDACGDGGELKRFAAGYFHAGQPVLAAKCVLAAANVCPEWRDKPRGGDFNAFRQFWNQTVLHELESAPVNRTAAQRTRLAEWAWNGGLAEDAERLLRRAWKDDHASDRIAALAKEWGLRLEAPFAVDLTPALDQELVSAGVQDEGTWVHAEGDRAFLTLPIRYDANVPGQTFARSTFRGRDARTIYGFRLPAVRRGHPILRTESDDPIYERVETAGVRGARAPQLMARNTSPPRVPGAPPMDPAAMPPTRLAATGWILLILEVPPSTTTITLEREDGTRDEIDLALLRHFREPLGEPAESLSSNWAQCLTLLNRAANDADAASLDATASLIVARISRDLPVASQASEDKSAERWGPVDAAVARATAYGNERLFEQTWNYFLKRGFHSVPADAVAALPAEQRLAWVRLVASMEENGPPAKQSQGSAMLGAALRSDAPEVCDAALSGLMAMGSRADWSVLTQASFTARQMALSHLDSSADRSALLALLTALIQNLDPVWVELVSEHARRLDLRVVSADDALLGHWNELTDDDARARYLTVLRSVGLDAVVYSRRFTRIYQEAASPSSSPALRDAAGRLILVVANSRATTAAAPFGLLVPRDTTDTIVRGLRDIATQAGPKLRRESLGSLLRLGYGEETVRGFMRSIAPDKLLGNGLQTLIAEAPGPAFAEARVSFLAFLLRPGRRALLEPVVSSLRDEWSNMEAENRWRLVAALKCGLDVSALDELSMDWNTPASAALSRWLYESTHMTDQERQRFSAAESFDERERLLADTDARRGQLVNGNYGALAILETTTCLASGPGCIAWSYPSRRQIQLPSVELRLEPDTNRYRVLLEDAAIGEGRVREGTPRIRSMEYTYGVMDSLAPDSFICESAPSSAPDLPPLARPKPPAGPCAIRSRKLRAALQSGMMRVDATAWLRAARVGPNGEPEATSTATRPAVPGPWPPLMIELKYGRFAGYCGTLSRRPLPSHPTVGQSHLLNVKIVLERMD